jgi:transposase-like protein
LLPKYKKDISDIEDKVIAMYARGMSERDISQTIEEIYGFSLSAMTVSQMTDAVLPLVKEWQNRPLHKIYPFVFIDALYVDMKVERCSQKRAIYVMIGIDEDGRKDVLGFWNKASEGADEWMKIFDEIQSRGVEKISFISADGLSGLERAVKACFGENTVFQRCIVHMVRNSLKYLPRSDYASFCSDIKDVYSAVSLDAALNAFDAFKSKWGNGHSKAVRVWTEQFKYVEQLFNYPVEIRRVIYTTNTIESVNSALRKVTNLKGALPGEDALNKLLYLRIQNLLKTWKGPVRFWSDIKKKLDICCPGWNELKPIG